MSVCMLVFGTCDVVSNGFELLDQTFCYQMFSDHSVTFYMLSRIYLLLRTSIFNFLFVVCKVDQCFYLYPALFIIAETNFVNQLDNLRH